MAVRGAGFCIDGRGIKRVFPFTLPGALHICMYIPGMYYVCLPFCLYICPLFSFSFLFIFWTQECEREEKGEREERRKGQPWSVTQLFFLRRPCEAQICLLFILGSLVLLFCFCSTFVFFHLVKDASAPSLPFAFRLFFLFCSFLHYFFPQLFFFLHLVYSVSRNSRPVTIFV